MSDEARISQLALWSIFVAFGVMAIKFIAAGLSGSVALYSDALESVVNVIAASIAFGAIRISRKPADANHPFGHHKAEYFSAVIEGVLIVLAAIMIFYEAARAMTGEHDLSTPGVGMAVNAVAATINLLWARKLIRAGTEARSPALIADGRHVMADVVTSLGVLVGLVLALLTGWTLLDPLMAIVVGINVLREGWKLVSASVEGLMDRAVDDDEAELIRETILAHADGAIEVHDLKTRRAGPATFIEFHLVVDGGMTVSRSHAICDRIEVGLRAALANARVTIHVEPDHKQKRDGLEIEIG